MLNAARQAQLVELCQELVRRPSLSGQEGAVAELVQKTMRSLGYSEVTTDAYGNVIGRISFGRPGKRLLLEAHLDHVDAGEREEWSCDPYGAVIADSRIYGRGTSDMKGALAAMLLAAAYLKEDQGADLTGELIVAGAVHEECFEGIASELIGEACRPDYVIIGEASQLNLKRGQRGRAEVILETYGRTAHSSNPDVGLNAAKKMVTLLSEVEKKFKPSLDPVLGPGILELTDIISSPYPGASVIPDRCRVTFDRRLLIGESPQAVLAQIEEIIATTAAADPELKARASFAIGEDKCYTGATIKAERFAPAWLLPEDHEYITTAVAGLNAVGLNPALSHYAFCTNGSYYAGKAGIPTLGFGPSRENLAHVIDEYIEIEQLAAACRGYYGIARAVLGKS